MAFEFYFAGGQSPEADNLIYELNANRLLSYVNDRKLIEHVYFLDMPLRQYCKKYNLNYSASLKRKKEILSKLSYILN